MITLVVMMENFIIHIILNEKEVLLFRFRDTFSTQIIIDLGFGLVTRSVESNDLIASIAVNFFGPVFKQFTNLIAEREPSGANIVISGKNFNFFGPRHHKFNNVVKFNFF